MSFIQAIGYLFQVARNFFDGKAEGWPCRVGSEFVGEGTAFGQVSDDESLFGRNFKVKNLEDVGMVELGKDRGFITYVIEQARFAQELLVQYFNSDQAMWLVLGIFGF